MPGDEQNDWPEIVERLADGDRRAFIEVSRLVSGYLSRWRAFDFRDDWDDVIQDVIISTVDAFRNQRLENPKAVVGYIRSICRNKMIDRIRARQRMVYGKNSEDEADKIHWPPVEMTRRTEKRELWDFVDQLSDSQQAVVMQIYVQGRTYKEASEASGIPLGSLKRYLRQALLSLHALMTNSPEP